MTKDFLLLKNYTKDKLLSLIAEAEKIKANPQDYYEKLKHKTLLMIFSQPSLRTKVSFAVGMHQLGGSVLDYAVSGSPLGKGKETIEDTAKTISRFCDVVSIRTADHEMVEALAKNASIPIINAMTNAGHPCQIMGDLLTIKEHKGTLEGLKLAYLGDSNNNVTYSLLYGCALMGIKIAIGCPADAKVAPDKKIIEDVKGDVLITQNAEEAVKDADIVYTDSWMSYRIADEEKQARIDLLKPYQVTADLMKHAKPDAIFMHCLPAQRDFEMTAEVIDGKQSVVFDQAENRLHIQKAILLDVTKNS